MQRASVYYVGEFCGRVELPWIYAKPRNLSDPNPIANQAIGLEEAAKSRSQLSHIAAEMEMLYLVLKNDREMNDAKDALASSNAMELSVTSANSKYKLTKGVVEEVV